MTPEELAADLVAAWAAADASEPYEKTVKWVTAAIREAVAAEREACALAASAAILARGKS